MIDLLGFILTMIAGLFVVGIIFTALYVLIGLSFDMAGSIWASITRPNRSNR